MLYADLEYLARTLYGEARGEGLPGQIAVACVVLNRTAQRHRRENTIAGVVTEPYQFSCWLDADPNRAKLLAVNLSDPVFRQCNEAALIAVGMVERGDDPTRGALHYHADSIEPAWALGKSPCARVGRHLFYSNID